MHYRIDSIVPEYSTARPRVGWLAERAFSGKPNSIRRPYKKKPGGGAAAPDGDFLLTPR
jgi:hypothetical protein